MKFVYIVLAFIVSALITYQHFLKAAVKYDKITFVETCPTITIKELISFQGRDATVLLSNGKIVKINQPTKPLKKGSLYGECYKTYSWK